MVAIDGCQIGCAKAILEQAQVPLKNYIVLTDEGIEKNKNLKLNRSDIDHVKAAVKRIIGGQTALKDMAPDRQTKNRRQDDEAFS